MKAPAAAVVLLALLPAFARAQPVCPNCLQNGDRVVPVDFALGPPGARGQGMGGAFAGLADDSTAARANPAALTQVLRPEISFECRDEGNAYAGASVAGKNWALAAFYHRLAEDHGPGTHLEIAGAGLAAAVRLGPIVSVGASWTRYRGEAMLTSASALFDFETRIDDEVGVFGAGIFLQNEGRWSGGVFYRQGGALAVEQEKRFIPLGQVTVTPGDPLELPRAWGFGIGFRPTPNLILDLDATRATYVRRSGSTKEKRDVDTFALGAEYSFWSLSWAPALRFGVAIDRNPLPPPPGAAEPDRIRLYAGAGVVFAAHWQLDAALTDLAGDDPEVSLATVIRF